MAIKPFNPGRRTIIPWYRRERLKDVPEKTASNILTYFLPRSVSSSDRTVANLNDLRILINEQMGFKFPEVTDITLEDLQLAFSDEETSAAQTERESIILQRLQELIDEYDPVNSSMAFEECVTVFCLAKSLFDLNPSKSNLQDLFGDKRIPLVMYTLFDLLPSRSTDLINKQK